MEAVFHRILRNRLRVGLGLPTLEPCMDVSPPNIHKPNHKTQALKIGPGCGWFTYLTHYWDLSLPYFFIFGS